MDLNVPDTRQRLLAERLKGGAQIVAADVAREFDVSLDTVRRDILALEADGIATRVRGGAVPVAPPLHHRLANDAPPSPALINATVAQISDSPTLLVDGGTTTLSLIAHLPPCPDRLIITPSPWVAIAAQERGIAAFLLGGRLSAAGGIATGPTALEETGAVSADIAILGACGLDAAFGLSSDDPDEASVKRALAGAARRCFVVTDKTKIGRRARHRTLMPDQIDTIITNADPAQTAPLARTGAHVITA